jgi:ParB family transcriptional regulator, chromosome partitioning protein
MTSSETRSSVRRKLGRGLGSLISTPVKVDVPAKPPPHLPAAPTTLSDAGGGPSRVATPPAALADRESAKQEIPSRPSAIIDEGLHRLQVTSIVPNPRQPRQHFNEAQLQTLANSIRISGVMQPIVVRPATSAASGSGGTAAASGGTGRYELIAGERRWRAAQIAGLTHIPAVVRDVDDRTAAEFSLVENLQREDLNPIERAQAFQRLLREFHLTHAEIAERVGLDRSSISNHLRLLELSGGAMGALRDGRLTMGHAKALLAITNLQARDRLAADALRQEWSVRELERQARAVADGERAESAADGKVGAKARGAKDSGGAKALMPAHLADLQKRLSEHLSTKVAIHPGRAKGSGKLVIDFYSIDQFEGLLRRMDFEMDE